LKTLAKILVSFIVLVALLAVSLLTLNDNRALEETPYYISTNKRLSTIEIKGGYGTSLKSGWSKENITPDYEIYLAGYGLRKNPASAVHDSIFVRSIVLDNGRQKIAMITMDLLIAPPLIVEQVVPALGKLGFGRENIYFSATHTHSSVGGWAGGLGGRAMAGPQNDRLIRDISAGIIRSVKKAASETVACKIGFLKINAGDYVSNRLIEDSPVEDPWLRIMKIEREDKQSALVLTYSAHPTNIPKKDNRISADYPGLVVHDLESSGLCNFAAFFAGAVGSMRPSDDGLDSYEKVAAMAHNLYSLIKSNSSSLKTDTTSLLKSVYFPLALHEPQLRLTKYIRIRPWAFNWIMGKQQIGMNALRIGNMIWIGTPCDYSGMMYTWSDPASKKIDKDLIITSFNGGYAGYITPDQYYNLHKPETQEMNWFGPYNGRYFSEVVNNLIVKAGR
jgi:neutral ceramidase